MTVRIAGKTHVVYELHVTNFLSVDVSLSRLQVRRADGSGVSIADYRDDELTRRIGRPGLRRDQENPQVIGPGMRAVVYSLDRAGRRFGGAGGPAAPSSSSTS